MTSLGDKGCQSWLRQRDKYFKIKVIDLSNEKCFD